jgi:D-3-phosphoglycerate dehydrogenase
MQKKYCLFSAPFNFLNKNIFLNAADYKFIFSEIWKQNDIKKNNKITSWIVNPGQNFSINEKILKFYPNLKIIITPSTGTNHIDLKVCKKNKIKVFSLLNKRKDLNKIRASSEFTFLLALNALRRLDIAFNEVDQDRWRHKENLLRGKEIFGKTIGIVGLGRIGSNLARWFSSFGAKVIYYDTIKKVKKFRKKSLDSIFRESDLTCICCILNSKTKNLINLQNLNLMKKNSILVNTSRGEVINEKDLINFLNTRKDIFFTTDVLSGEIKGTNLKSRLIDFHKNRRILISPHIAGATLESQSQAANIAVKILKENL